MLKTVISPILAFIAIYLACTSTAAEDQPVKLTALYRQTANRLMEAAKDDDDSWRKMHYLCDYIGPRLSGSPQLAKAVEWAREELERDGHDDVRVQPIEIPRWVRGKEFAAIVEPANRPLAMLGLGGSVATPKSGITAEIVSVKSFDELLALGEEKIAGKIVLYNVPYEGYGKTVLYRGIGASEAAKLGAVAILLRSVGPVSLQTPHTGALLYQEDAEKIPAAAITIEGATMIQRFIDFGATVKVHLYMEAQFYDNVMSGNVIGQITGSEIPQEVVVMGGHLDSWDVGQGAHDDGAGCVAAMSALRLVRRLGLKPRRTLRVVLWTNEENGLKGALGYHQALSREQIDNHVAAIEMDGGAERPLGFRFGLRPPEGAEISMAVYDKAMAKAKQIGLLLEPIGASRMLGGGGGADIGPLMREGVPGFGLHTVGEKYFHWHHTEADTLDKIDPNDLRDNAISLAVLGYVLADMPERLVAKGAVR